MTIKNANYYFLQGGGEMGELIRAKAEDALKESEARFLNKIIEEVKDDLSEELQQKQATIEVGTIIIARANRIKALYLIFIWLQPDRAGLAAQTAFTTIPY